MNIYRAKSLITNKVIEGQYTNFTCPMITHWVDFYEWIPEQIDPSTLEVVKLDLNSTQIAWLKNVAYKDLIAFQEGFNFLSDECMRIFYDSENYDSQVIEWAIELLISCYLKSV